MARCWNLGLDVLTFDNVDKGSFNSGGDEISVATTALRSKPPAPGSERGA